MANTPPSSSSSVPLVNPNHEDLPEHVAQAEFQSSIATAETEREIQTYLNMSDLEFLWVLESLEENPTKERRDKFTFLLSNSPPLFARLKSHIAFLVNLTREKEEADRALVQ